MDQETSEQRREIEMTNTKIFPLVLMALALTINVITSQGDDSSLETLTTNTMDVISYAPPKPTGCFLDDGGTPFTGIAPNSKGLTAIHDSYCQQ